MSFRCFAFAGLLVLLASGCGAGQDPPPPPGGNSTADPYAGLWNVPIGEVKCNGDSCCLKRCWGNQDTICVTRDPTLILHSFAPAHPFTEDCDTLIFEDWFVNYDCFIGVNGYTNPLTGEPLGFVDNTYDADKRRAYFSFVQCFCGRTATTYASEYSTNVMTFRYDSCGAPLVAFDLRTGEQGFDPSLATCDNPCNTCVRNCAGRECGFDGCGGSCGTCVQGETCSATGKCVTEQDTCSSCIASCRGLPGCCMGCGCICQSACGQCF